LDALASEEAITARGDGAIVVVVGPPLGGAGVVVALVAALVDGAQLITTDGCWFGASVVTVTGPPGPP
jgi:hypothetical protein